MIGKEGKSVKSRSCSSNLVVNRVVCLENKQQRQERQLYYPQARSNSKEDHRVVLLGLILL